MQLFNLSASFGKVALDAHDLRERVQIGHVIGFGHPADDPIALVVDGATVAEGALVVTQNELALKITKIDYPQLNIALGLDPGI